VETSNMEKRPQPQRIITMCKFVQPQKALSTL